MEGVVALDVAHVVAFVVALVVAHAVEDAPVVVEVDQVVDA